MAETVYSLGSILVDVTVDVPGLPERGGDVLATGTRTLPGGGFNLAAAVARQDVSCVYAAPHGTGPHGDLIREALAAEGVRVAAERRDSGDSGFCVVLVEPDGERTFVTRPGVEAVLTAGDLAAVRPSTGDVVSVSGYDLVYPGSGPVLEEWLGDLPREVFVAVDPGPLIRQIPAGRLARVLRRTDLLTLNRREAQLLADSPATGAALLETLRPAAAMVVVREGSDGCVATGGSLGDRVVPIKAPQVRAVDTTGAGDSHTGVLLASLAAGLGVEEALDIATRAAAVAVTRIGPATTPTRAELAATPFS
jgi:sugar/nucleoside kinase (ribokinase family)